MCSGNYSPCDCSLHSFQYRYCTWDTKETDTIVSSNSSSLLKNDSTCVIIPLCFFFLKISIHIWELFSYEIISIYTPLPTSSWQLRLKDSRKAKTGIYTAALDCLLKKTNLLLLLLVKKVLLSYHSAVTQSGTQLVNYDSVSQLLWLQIIVIIFCLQQPLKMTSQLPAENLPSHRRDAHTPIP